MSTAAEPEPELAEVIVTVTGKYRALVQRPDGATDAEMATAAERMYWQDAGSLTATDFTVVGRVDGEAEQ